MRYRLKPDSFQSIVNQYSDEAISFEESNDLVYIKITKNNLIETIFPYFHNILQTDIISHIGKYSIMNTDIKIPEKDGNNILIQVKANKDESYIIIQKDTLEMKDRLFDLLKSHRSLIFDGELKDNEVEINGVLYPSEYFEATDESEIICTIVSDINEFDELVNNQPQIHKIKYFNNNYQALEDKKGFFVVLLKNEMVIGLSQCEFFDSDPETAISLYTSILDSEKGNNYSKLILEKKVKYLSYLDKKLGNSSYTSNGFNYLRKNTLQLCEEYGISLKEQGLIDAAQSMPEEIYRVQKKLEESLNSALSYKNEYFNMPDKFVKASIRDNKDKIVAFMNLNPYSFAKNEEIQKNEDLLRFFLVNYDYFANPI